MQQEKLRTQRFQGATTMGYQCSFAIDKLISNIGVEAGEKLLSEALPIIISRKRIILQALEKRDIVAAAECAHSTSGSIRLYGSSRLEELLREVMSLPVDKAVPSKLINGLETEFDTAILEIHKRIDSPS